MVLRKASAFICATIKSSPLLASVTTQVINPAASNLGWKESPSSISLLCSDTGETPAAPDQRGAPRNKVMKRNCCSLLSLNSPVKCVVTVEAPALETPRTDMHI